MENKAKRFLRLLLVIAMVMAVVPMTFALATETNVAQIGETGYATLEEAFAAAKNGETVELIADSYEDIVIPADFSGTLAIGTCTINSITNNSATAEIVINGNVVVENANGSAITGEVINISGNGTLTAIANGDHAYGIGGDNTKSITIENVHILKVQGGHYGEIGTDTKYYKDAPEGGAAIGSGSNGAVITLTNVTIDKALGGSKAAGIGALYHTGVTVNITGCKITYVEGGATAAGIGGSRVSNGATASENVTINIKSSNITAVGGVYAAGIGSGYDTHCQENQPICTINIDGSTIDATGGKYAAGVGTGYHNAGMAGEIKNSTITAASGEKVYKDTYTSAQDVGFGVVDMTREGSDNDSYIIYNGTKITLPGKAVAQIGETKYATLQEAIDAANDQGTATVTLLKDVEFAGISQGNKVVGLTISGNVTISGAHTITRADTYTGTLFAVNSGATLTLDGGLTVDGNNNWSINENNVVTPEAGKPIATGYMIVNSGTLNIYDATLQNQYSEGTGGNTEGAIIAKSNSVINLKGATIQHFYAQDAGSAVRMGHGSGSCSNATLNIGEGTNITGNIGDWNGAIIIAYGANTINMTGGSINNNTANSNGTLIMLYNATMNMSGGVITENKGPVSAIYMHSTANFVMSGGEISKNTGGYALYVRSDADSVSISGDSKIINNSGDVYVSSSKTDDVQISGGTYTQDVSQWCAEGFTCEKRDDGTWGVVKQDPLVLVAAGGQNKYFVDLNEALQYAYSCSSTDVSVHILGNLTVTEPIVIRDDDMVKNSVEMRSSDLSKNFTITATGSEFIKMESGTLYIKSLNINAENDAFYVTGGTVELRCYHTVHVTNVTSQKGNCVYIRGGTVNVYGANLTSNGEYPAIQGNGAYAGDVKIGIWQYSTNKATSKITAPNSDMAIYWPGNGKLTIDAGTITGDTALYAKSGTIIINGGEFYGTGDAVVIESCKDAAYETPVVTIKGGKFVSDNADAIGVYNCNEAKPMTKFISGGLFSSAPAPEWCAEGMGPKHAEDNMWTVGTGIVTVDGVYFDDWKVAKTYIHGSSVIVLYAAVENEGSFSVGAANKTVTLDLNGKTFTTTTIGVDGHKTLHITDSASGGTVKVTNYTALYANGYLNVDSDVNFNSYIQINRHSDDQQPSTGCLLIDGVKWIGLGHFQQTEKPIFGTTGGYVTVGDNFKMFTFTSGKFYLNKEVDFTNLAQNEGITVNADATLDLNGNSLTADSVVSIGDVIDTAKKTTGGVKVNNDAIQVNPNNTHMPIYDGENGYYRFFEYTLQSKGPEMIQVNKQPAAKFGIYLRFTKLDAYKLIANQDATHYVSLPFVLTINGQSYECTFNPGTIAKWAAAAWTYYKIPENQGEFVLMLAVKGLDVMEDETSLTIVPTVGSYVKTSNTPTALYTVPCKTLTVTKADVDEFLKTLPTIDPTKKEEESGDDGSTKSSATGGDDPDAQNP